MNLPPPQTTLFWKKSAVLILKQCPRPYLRLWVTFPKCGYSSIFCIGLALDFLVQRTCLLKCDSLRHIPLLYAYNKLYFLIINLWILFAFIIIANSRSIKIQNWSHIDLVVLVAHHYCFHLKSGGWWVWSQGAAPKICYYGSDRFPSKRLNLQISNEFVR